jgi:hypothetical protein
MSDPLNALGFLSWGLLGSGSSDSMPTTQIIESIQTHISVLESDIALELYTDDINIALSIDPGDIKITCEVVEITAIINSDETMVEIHNE